MPAPRLLLPRGRPPNAWWLLASALAHVAFLALLMGLPAHPAVRRPLFTLIDLSQPAPEDSTGDATPAPDQGGRSTGRARGRMPDRVGPANRSSEEKPAPAPPGALAALEPERTPVDAPLVVAPSSPEAPAPEAPQVVMEFPYPDVGADSLPSGTRRRLGPEYGDGRLWVDPEDAVAGRLPSGPVGGSALRHFARVDSTLRARLLAYIDTMPPDSFQSAIVPKWKAQIGGRPWGIDSKWIYLGDLKLPTALLALIPFPQGNYDQAQKAEMLQRMREDLLYAAQRAETAAEFRRYVKEIRKRKDTERATEKRQPPPAPKDTLIP